MQTFFLNLFNPSLTICESYLSTGSYSPKTFSVPTIRHFRFAKPTYQPKATPCRESHPVEKLNPTGRRGAIQCFGSRQLQRIRNCVPFFQLQRNSNRVVFASGRRIARALSLLANRVRRTHHPIPPCTRNQLRSTSCLTSGYSYEVLVYPCLRLCTNAFRNEGGDSPRAERCSRLTCAKLHVHS